MHIVLMSDYIVWQVSSINCLKLNKQLSEKISAITKQTSYITTDVIFTQAIQACVRQSPLCCLLASYFSRLDLKLIACIRSFVDESHKFLHLRNYSQPEDEKHSKVHEVCGFWPINTSIFSLSARLQANSMAEHTKRKLKTEIHAFWSILSIWRILKFQVFPPYFCQFYCHKY